MVFYDPCDFCPYEGDSHCSSCRYDPYFFDPAPDFFLEEDYDG